MSSQVNQQFEMQALNQMDPSPYQCISPSEHPIYSSNVPSANPAWNICNGAPITSMKSQQWNIYPAATIPSMAQSQNVLPGSVMPHLKCKPKVMGIQGSLCLSILICVFSVAGLSLNIVDYLAYYFCYSSHSYYCSSLIVGSQVLCGLFILTYLLQFAVSVSLSVFAFRVQEHLNSTPPTQVFVIQIGGEVLQASPVPGSYPTYPSKQPPSYMTKSVMRVGATAYQNPSS
ncbi:uncharacterized protein LOC120910723 [Rana temporaria]|uniref:uncharacterized protein LOC120910723 n=1 Tax=Rana temporaria TaxID=8407 RepID=UPI001AAD1159|nr:uncharacterized protein LOC120910723 [Rana temporaria]